MDVYWLVLLVAVFVIPLALHKPLHLDAFWPVTLFAILDLASHEDQQQKMPMAPRVAAPDLPGLEVGTHFPDELGPILQRAAVQPLLRAIFAKRGAAYLGVSGLGPQEYKLVVSTRDKEAARAALRQLLALAQALGAAA